MAHFRCLYTQVNLSFIVNYGPNLFIISYDFRIKVGSEDHDCLVITGSLTDGAKQFVVAVTTTKLPSTIEVSISI
jgi:hypothetical protein